MTSRHERLGYGSAVLGLLTILFLASTAKVGTAQVARTWEEARVFFPGSAVPVNPAKVPARDDPLPTVLYLTGCTGFDYSHDGTMGRWAQTLTSASYAVVMPTSFAREHRPHACEQSTYTYHAELADEYSACGGMRSNTRLRSCALDPGWISAISSLWVTAKVAPPSRAGPRKGSVAT